MLTAALTRRAVLTIGLMSYSLYLWHWSLLVLTRWTIGLSPKTAPFLLAATFAVAALSYRHIERPMRHTRWFPTKLATVGRGAVVTVIAAALVMGINKNVTRALYAGHGLHTSEFSLLADKRIGDAVRWRARDCVLASHRDVGKSISAEACTLRLPAQNASRQFLVVGNSSNVAQFEMVSSIVEQGLGSMTLVSSWGAMPIPELVGGDKVWRESNFDFWNRVVPELLRRLVRGDVLVMISDMVPNLPAVPGAADHQAFATMERVLDALAAELNVRGIAILFQAPMTFLRDAGCTPEMGRPQWFRPKSSIDCRYLTRGETEARRRPVLDILRSIERAHPNFHVLDLLPIFCPGDTCDFFNADGVFLYRDAAAHPSIEANMFSRPRFLAAVTRAVGPGALHEK